MQKHIIVMAKFLRGILVSGIGDKRTDKFGIEIDKKYETEAHYQQNGIVEEVGLVKDLEYMYGERENAYVPDVLVDVGQEVRVTWGALSKGFEVEPGLWWCAYEDIIGKWVDGELIPLNGNIFYKTTTGTQDKINRKTGVVTAVATDCGSTNVQVGDKIGTRAGFEIEMVYHQELADKLFYVNKNNVIWCI